MVLAVVQAMVGAITPNVLAVSVFADAADSRLDVFLAVDGNDPRLEELVDQVVLDIDALTACAVRIEAHIWEGTTWVSDSWEGRRKRFVFARATASLWAAGDE